MARFIVREKFLESVVFILDESTGTQIFSAVLDNIESVEFYYYCADDRLPYRFTFKFDSDTTWLFEDIFGKISSRIGEQVPFSPPLINNFGEGVRKFLLTGCKDNGSFFDGETFSEFQPFVRLQRGPTSSKLIFAPNLSRRWATHFAFCPISSTSTAPAHITSPSLEIDRWISRFLRPVNLAPSSVTPGPDPRVDLLIRTVTKIIEGDLYPWAVRYLRGDGSSSQPIEYDPPSYEQVRCLFTTSSQQQPSLSRS
jgi:hypothetical protein